MQNRGLRRILMTADTVGGVWTYALELISGLAQRGVEVALATMGTSPDRNQRKQIAGIRNLSLFESRYKLEWMNDPWEEVDLAGEWLSSLAQCLSPDIVHLNGYAHGAIEFEVPVLIAGHSCVFSWYKSVKGDIPHEPEWQLYHSRVRDGLARADYIVAPTRSMLESLSLHYGVSFRGKVISNGRAGEEYVPRIKDPLVLTAGRLWDEAKNITALEAIAARLPWKVYAAGDGLDHAHSDLIHWLGKCSSRVLAAWMSRASIYALPAKYEPFGLSVLEAGLCGCALVLGDIPSLREIWEDCALFVNPDDPDQLQSTILSFIHQPWLRREYAERARRRALEFTPDKMGEAYWQLYQELLESRKEPLDPTERILCA